MDNNKLKNSSQKLGDEDSFLPSFMNFFFKNPSNINTNNKNENDILEDNNVQGFLK